MVSGQFEGEQDVRDDDNPYGPAKFMTQTGYYTLTLYPNEDFFYHYATSVPLIATCGAVLIVTLTSLMFLGYDFAVRREFDSKRQLLEAKVRNDNDTTFIRMIPVSRISPPSLHRGIS